ncbi:MAG: SIMPL domain-containing protein [Bacteroidota bacterium]|jgi:hypothetical protein
MNKNTLRFLFLPISILLASWIFSVTWKRTHKQGETITVTGLSSRDFSSDLIVWSGSFSAKASDLKEAYKVLISDQALIKDYLEQKGITAKEMLFSSVSINRDYNSVYNPDGSRKDVFTGYTLSQKVEISSKRVAVIEKIAREVTEILNKDIEFYSNPPEYYYIKLDELKLQMLAEAAANARLRAERMAENAGASLGKLRSADMGIFQITARNSGEDLSWGGTFNTSSKEKTARITIKASYFVD